MKILQERYPMGSIKSQKTPGRYIDGTLHENLKVLARNINKDMTYLGIITSSTLEVGTGKSVFAQQMAEAYLELVKEYHKIDNKLTMQNITFHPKDLIERSFKIPKYSVVILDEWEDTNYWSQLGISLRQFFRKCRQLNLFMIIIIPNFFQLPSSYAISRSVFLVDVKFEGEFDRGYFSFYNFNTKRSLYIRGKKTQDYSVVRSNFYGRFADGYVVNEDEYRTAKLKDLTDQEDKANKVIDPLQIRREIFREMKEALKGRLTVEELSKAFKIHERTAYKWLDATKDQEPEPNINEISIIHEKNEVLPRELSVSAVMPRNNRDLPNGTG